MRGFSKSEIRFFLKQSFLLGKLKHVKRSGWVRRHVSDPESVASHSYRMAMMAMLLQKQITSTGADFLKVMQMALCHDTAESIVGDILPLPYQKGKKITKEEKHQKESRAILRFSSVVQDFFNEYDDKQTPESLWCHDLDILDLIIQAYEYKKKQGVDLDEFFLNKRKLHYPESLAVIDELLKKEA